MIKPLYDRILLEEILAESATASGILLPESKEKPSMARVVAVGNGAKDKEGNTLPMDVKVGDCVIYKKYATTDVTYQNKDYLIIDMKDVLAIVEDDK
ncbi:co-chaperone GroES [Erysipelothrix sp. strain 2 (EsS2-6-Brazil)]|uniref:co-chaperone GroES n=1 Tax=Erysipelothrix sp. strain 2 (EsS2-6-Brazil) TaxID=2500549 RepID=UPI00190A0461|nr:co-chaperone GroES [Erysipelothrix sp. strain 2 (EsS2-6-Brazil)]MBK2402834.1 co-chaperone GroES [Erysipelothrix sp. strain 2 (EsS2-6-Brazil)]